MRLPPWLSEWLNNERGASARTIAVVLAYQNAECMIAPFDYQGIGQCVQLLDLAEANGKPWRSQLSAVATRCPEWAPLVAHWPRIEAAWREDFAAVAAWEAAKARNPRRPRPPSLSEWLVKVIRFGIAQAPYQDRAVPWDGPAILREMGISSVASLASRDTSTPRIGLRKAG